MALYSSSTGVLVSVEIETDTHRGATLPLSATEAAVGDMHLQAKEHQGLPPPPEARKRKGRAFRDSMALVVP